MPMERDRHEEILAQLSDGELNHDEKIDLLQELRTDYGSVLEDTEKFTKDIDKLKDDNYHLTVSNSKMFRNLGIQDDPDKQKEQEEKDLSETITVSQIEQQQSQQ